MKKNLLALLFAMLFAAVGTGTIMAATPGPVKFTSFYSTSGASKYKETPVEDTNFTVLAGYSIPARSEGATQIKYKMRTMNSNGTWGSYSDWTTVDYGNHPHIADAYVFFYHHNNFDVPAANIIAIGVSSDGTEGPQTEVTLNRVAPSVIFSKEPGTYPAGTKLKIVVSSNYIAPLAWTIKQNGNVVDNDGALIEQTYNYTITENTKFEVTVKTLFGGITNTVTAEYLFEQPKEPAVKAYYKGEEIADCAVIPAGDKVTFKGEYVDALGVSAYSITGSLPHVTPVYQEEQTVTVDKMHRRFQVIGHLGNDKEAIIKDFFFDVREAVGTTHWKQVQNLNEIKAGSRVVIGTDYTFTRTDAYAGEYFEQGVMSKTTDRATATHWRFADAKFNRSGAAWTLSGLPEDAQVITLVSGSAANTYKLKTDDGKYFYAPNNENGLKLGTEAEATEFVFSTGKDNNLGTTIKIAAKDQTSRSVIVSRNYTWGVFSHAVNPTSSNNNEPVILLVETDKGGLPVNYELALHYTTFNYDDYTGNHELESIYKEAAKHNLHDYFAEMTPNNHQVKNSNDFCGQFVITIEGVEVGGDVKDERNDFHAQASTYSINSDNSSCNTQHASYVHLSTDNAVGLQNMAFEDGEENDRAVALSTLPNHYHGDLTLYNANKSTLTVELDPFYSANLSLAVEDNGTTGVESIVVNEADEDAPAVYYDLNGRRIQGNPATGLYIEVRGTKAQKVLIR